MQTSLSDTPIQKPETLTVSQLNRQAKRLLETHFRSVWVEGEISNLSRPSSGHWYFSLKDSNAQVRCAMFRGNNAKLRFEPEAGQQVMIRAKLSLYEARGDYQLIVDNMKPAGDGALALAFEQLKNKLQQEGLFDPELKKPLPTTPEHIAVVTSATGAAIRDILSVLERRFAGIKITLLPTAVQGQNAAQDIAKAINTANHLVSQGKQKFEVILVGRGGGSIEDLWSFNEEIVARAIANSHLPVVSAVGHEVDFTIADFVADVRAATPSAAAELLSPDSQELLETLVGFEQLLTRQMRLNLHSAKQSLSWQQSRLRHPGSRLQEHNQRLDELELRLSNSWSNQFKQRQTQLHLVSSQLHQQTPSHQVAQLKQKSGDLFRRLETHIQRHLQQQRQRLNNSIHLLDTVSPLATLERGYAITSDQQGNILKRTDNLAVGDILITRLSKGKLTSTVTTIENA